MNKQKFEKLTNILKEQIEVINSSKPDNFDEIKKSHSIEAKTLLQQYYFAKEQTIIVLNTAIDEYIKEIMNIKNLKSSYFFDVENYYNSQLMSESFEEYVKGKEPTYEEVCNQLHIKKANIILEKIFKNRKEKRIKEEENARKIFNEKLESYNKDEKNKYIKYEKSKENYIKSIKNINEKINSRKNAFITKNSKEVLECFREYLKNVIKEINIGYSGEAAYAPEYNTCVIKYNFLEYTDIIPDIKSLKYIKSKDVIEIQYYTEKEKKQLYENYVYQITLKIIEVVLNFNQEIFKEVIFNGILNTLNTATGLKEDFLFLSVKVNLNQFKALNIEFVNPKDCLEMIGMKCTEDLFKVKNVVPYEIEVKNTATMSNIDSEIDGFQFENLSKEILEANGFKDVIVTSASGDYGADIIAIKNDIKYAIQCKKYSQPVGVKAIQEVMGSKSIYNCHVAAVLTNNTFTPQAQKLANQNNVLLWDREKLKELIQIYENKNK